MAGVAAPLHHFFVNFSDMGSRVGAVDSLRGVEADMIRLFKHYIPHAVLLLGAIDFLLLLAGAEAGWALRLWQIEADYVPFSERLHNVLAFAVTLQLAMVAVGVYSPEAMLSVRFAAARLVVAFAIGILALSLLYFLAPPVAFWRSSLLYATLFALAAMITARAAFRGTMSGAKLKRRVVTWARARARRGSGGSPCRKAPISSSWAMSP
jgi:hypothetical protein